MPFFPDNSLLLCFPRVRCTAVCRKENKERRCVPLYQVAWEPRGYSLSLCRWEGQGLEKWNVYPRSSTSGSRRTLGEPELATLVPAPLSHRSLRDAGPFVLTNLRCLKLPRVLPSRRKIVLECFRLFWNQIEVRMLAGGFHINSISVLMEFRLREKKRLLWKHCCWHPWFPTPAMHMLVITWIRLVSGENK